MSSPTELVVTGVATAELMERIRNAHDEEAVKNLQVFTDNIPLDTRIATLVEVVGTSIFLDQKLATAEEKLNYACSTAGLVVSFTAELMKQMVEASNVRAS